jgi:dTDP-6-deoxy-L-talose 4-dehydrogenase (NAD+)
VSVAVTGARGFVGRHVVAELSRRSIATVAVARSNSGDDPELPHVRTVLMDVTARPEDPFEFLGSPHTVIDLAWDSLEDYRSSTHLDREVPAHFDFVKAMVEGGTKHVLVAGTCLEYGMQSGALNENLDAMPTLPYARAKDTLRQRLENLAADKGFTLTWARLFYLYGEDQGRSSLFQQMERAAARGEKSFDLSGGDQLRDYLPVTEAARLLVDLALNEHAQGIVNVCSGRPVSVRTVAERWVTEFGWPLELRFGLRPYNDYEPMNFWGDRTKVDQYLAPKTELQ